MRNANARPRLPRAAVPRKHRRGVLHRPRGPRERARREGQDRAAVQPCRRTRPARTFFEPTLRPQPGEVYQSRPYVSPDTNEWVVANSTPIRAAGQAKPAIVHFEITIESFSGEAAAVERPVRRRDRERAHRRRRSIDSRFKQRAGKPIPHKHPNGIHLHPAVPLGHPQDDASSPSPTRTPGRHTGRRRQARPHSRAWTSRPHNANRWIVAAVSPTAAAAWYESLGVSEIAILLGALLLIGFGVVTLRSSQRELKDAALRDSLTGMREPPQPDGGPRGAHATTRRPSARCCWRSSTSTASRRTTTRSAIRSATRCSCGSASNLSDGGQAGRAARIAWAETSSACSPRSRPAVRT